MTVLPQVPEIAGYHNLTTISRRDTALVLRSVEAGLDETVAVKVLAIDGHPPATGYGEREPREAALLSNHPYIVDIFRFGQTSDGNPYVAMEYSPEGCYANLLGRHGRPPIEEVIEMGWRVAEALQAAHNVGVLHGAVKPSNILRLPSGPVLTDFAFARVPYEPVATGGPGPVAPYHTAPEVIADGEQSPVSDLYGLAATMWHLLAGRPLFANSYHPVQDSEDLLRAVLSEQAPPLDRGDVPRWLQVALGRALDKDPARRYPSLTDFAEVLHGRGTDTGPVQRPQPADPLHIAGSRRGVSAPIRPGVLPGPFTLRPADGRADQVPDSRPLRPVDAEDRASRDAAEPLPDDGILPPPRWSPADDPRDDQTDHFDEDAAPWLDEPIHRRRPPFAVLVAVLVAAALTLTGVVVWRVNVDATPPTTTPGTGTSATATLSPAVEGSPADIKLVDGASEITLTWTDTTGGTAQFAVLGGPRSAEPVLLKVLRPGSTTLTVQGLNVGQDYCYVVLAILGTDQYARSGTVCTERS
ncbi:serine/threonine protein kinase [Solwaraspora sp. WMMB335]|uniref:serine/threonine protein kinase n=1 Tax=Solwaraspora sp. WMMB335 TaxID=3404118 RepID=UPI003B93B52D